MDDDGPLFKVKRRKVSHKPAANQDTDEVNDGESTVVRGKAPNSRTAGGLKIRQHTTTESDNGLVSHESNRLSHGLSNRFVTTALPPTYIDRSSTSGVGQAVSESQYTNFRRESVPDSDQGRDDTEVDGRGPISDRKNSAAEQTPPQVLSEVSVEMRQSKRPDQQDKRRRKPKVRLGWDGKPMKPRPRQGPSAEEIERAKLVEQLLHEQGPNEYAAVPINLGSNQEADDQLADEFQSQFMNAVADKAQRQATKASGDKSSANTPSGPRLGGGRSARAKMAQQAKTTPVDKK